MPRPEQSSYSHLTAIGKGLTHSLDFDSTLDHVARLPIPGLADWCLAYTPGDGDVRAPRLVVAHSDPGKEALLRDACQGQSTMLPREHPVQVSLRTRKPVIHDTCGGADLELLCSNGGRTDMLHALRPQSVLAVPMVAHGLVVGVLMLVITSRRRRRFNQAALEAATATANCAAQAIYNAQLFWEARMAARMREELAAVGSQDLLYLASGMQQRVNSLRCELSGTQTASVDAFDRGLSDIERLATAIRQRLYDLRAAS